MFVVYAVVYAIVYAIVNAIVFAVVHAVLVHFPEAIWISLNGPFSTDPLFLVTKILP